MLFSWLKRLRSEKAEVDLENSALGQQLVILQRQGPKPKNRGLDRLFWPSLFQVWMGWQDTASCAC